MRWRATMMLKRTLIQGSRGRHVSSRDCAESASAHRRFPVHIQRLACPCRRRLLRHSWQLDAIRSIRRGTAAYRHGVKGHGIAHEGGQAAKNSHIAVHEPAHVAVVHFET